jgi:NAD(P)-dependent dehydrogenase (short-subunit alcohol dehydrogenase family)
MDTGVNMIIITGASKGIGKYLLEKYADNGRDVYGTFNSTAPIDTYANRYQRVDVSSTDNIKNWFNNICSENENITIINAAGVNYNSFAHKSDLDKWKHVIEVNLFGTFSVIREILPRMRRQKYGRIINCSSIVAQLGIPGTSAYAASKSALWGLTKSLAVENASLGITINNLNLGYFDIGMGLELPEAYRTSIKTKIPTEEFGNPENIYNAIQFLRESDYVNGTSIDINAGLF